jgi:Tfp pilus assembly protein PilW
MKLRCSPFAGSPPGAFHAWKAFTITEIMVTMAILFLFITGILYAHLFGIRMFEITRAKLGASDDARRAISLLVSEIRTAKSIKIGNGSLSSFAEVPINTAQIGNAIQIYTTTNTNAFIRYFWDSADNKLKRTADGSTTANVIAHYITNNTVFTSEDFAGNVITDNQNNRVIGLSLQFYQIQYPAYTIGPGNYYDFYQLRAKVTRRALE